MSAESDSATLEILLEALEIFAHDLSNPLQSLIVLTELALDDAAPNSEDELRCRQTLEAAERMRIRRRNEQMVENVANLLDFRVLSFSPLFSDFLVD